MSRQTSVMLGCAVLGVLLATQVAAQGAVETGDGVIDQLKVTVDSMGDRLSGVVIGILVTLLAVDIVLTFGRAVISGANLGDVVGPFLMRFAFVGLAWFFAQNAASIVDFLIETTLRIGQQARGSEVTQEPSVGNILLDGFNFAMAAIGEVSVWKPYSIFNILAAIIIVLTSAIIAALLVLVYAEFYIIAFSGLIVLAFAGTSSTKDAAVTYLRTILGQSLKLLGFLITYAVMQEISANVLAADGVALGQGNLIMAIMVQVLLVVLVSTIPTAMQGLAGGISGGGASDMAAKGAAGAMIVGGSAAAGVAGGAAVGSAMGGAGAALGSMGSSSVGSAISSVAKGAMSGAKSGGIKGAQMGARAGGVSSNSRNSSVSASTAKMISDLATKMGK